MTMSQNTKVTIIEAFERLLREKKFEDIIVKDITDECGLNRKTFYYYFSDIDNLMDATFDHEVECYYKSLSKDISIEDAISGFFNMVSDNREIIDHIYNSSRSEHLENYIHRTLFMICEQDVKTLARGKKITIGQREMIANAITFIITGFIIKWINEGMQENVNELVRQIYGILSGLNGTMIDNAIRFNAGK